VCSPLINFNTQLEVFRRVLVQGVSKVRETEVVLTSLAVQRKYSESQVSLPKWFINLNCGTTGCFKS